MLGCKTRWLMLSFGVIASGWTTTAFAQGNIFNPYGNSGYADYSEFSRATSSIDPSLPGQARLQYGNAGGRNQANQFNSYVNANSVEGNPDQFNANRGVSSGLPYYQAQRLSGGSGQSYRSPLDKQYQDLVKRRNEAYFQALAEKDPRKRALRLQQIERQDIMSELQAKNQRPAAAAAARRPAASSARPAAAPGVTAPRPAAATSSPAPSPVTNPSSVPITAPAPN